MPGSSFSDVCSSLESSVSNRLQHKVHVSNTTDQNSGLLTKKKQVKYVYALIAHFIRKIRTGTISAFQAKQSLAYIIAMIISLGLGSNILIIRALSEAQYLFQKYFPEETDICQALGQPLIDLSTNTDPSSLLFLTTEELGIKPELEINPNNLLKILRAKWLNGLASQKGSGDKSKSLGKTILSKTLKLVKKPMVRVASKVEGIARFNLPYFLTRRKRIFIKSFAQMKKRKFWMFRPKHSTLV